MNNTYIVLSTIDDMIQRTSQFVKTTLASQNLKEIGSSSAYWVFYSEPNNSFELELVPHLPKPLEDEPLLSSVRADSNTFFKCDPEKERIRVHKNHLRLVNEFIEITKACSQDSFLAFLNPVEPGPEPPFDVQTCFAQLGDIVVTVSLAGGLSPRKVKPNQKAVSVPDNFIQVLFGIRSMLLILLDSSSRLCHDKDGYLDNEFIGNSPPQNVFDALDKMSTWSLEDFVPNMKYWKDRPLASFLGNDLPPRPQSWSHSVHDPLFTGRIGDYFRRLSTPSRVETPFGSQLFRASFSLAQAKKGCHPVPDSFIKNAFIKHSKILSEPAPLVEEYPELKAFLKVFFRNFNPSGLLKDLLNKEASTSASNSYSRALGGVREEIRNSLFENDDVGPSNGLIRMVMTNKGVVEERGFLPPSLLELRKVASRPIKRDFSSLNFQTLSHIPTHQRNIPYSMVRGITEPLKTRIITAMSALSSHLSGPLQTSLWKFLNTFPQFRLTSETISSDHIHWLLSAQNKLDLLVGEPTERRFFNSGDYSSATDRIHLKATQIVLEEIKTRIDSPRNPTRDDDVLLFPHFDEILSPQWLIYPAETGVKPFIQKNGQLMGSRLSFPILCILNFWTYFRSLPDSIRARILSGKLSLKSLPVLINGDDILFKSIRDQWNRWRDAGRLIGLELSVGKNFTHPNYCTINSVPISIQEFEYNEIVLPPRFSVKNITNWADLDEISDLEASDPSLYHQLYEKRVIPVLPTVEVMSTINVGLLIGLSKTSKGVRDDNIPLSGWFDGAVLGSFDPEQAAKWFFHYHRDEIKRQTRFGSVTLNLFAHPLLGGLGFTRPSSLEVHYTQQQRHLAYRLLQGILALDQKFIHPEESPLLSFHYLRGSTPHRPSLGNKPGKIPFSLGPKIGPLTEGVTKDIPDRRIYNTVLSYSLVTGEDPEGLVVKTRLTNSELKRILKTANNYREPVLNLDSLESFPYAQVFDPSLINSSFDSKTLNESLPEEITSTPEGVDLDLTWESQVFQDPPLRSSPPISPNPSVNHRRRETRAAVRQHLSEQRRSELRW